MTSEVKFKRVATFSRVLFRLDKLILLISTAISLKTPKFHQQIKEKEV